MLIVLAHMTGFMAYLTIIAAHLMFQSPLQANPTP